MKLLISVSSIVVLATFIQAQHRSASFQKLELGYVTDIAFGCGCSLSRTDADQQNSLFVFLEPMDDSAYINANGRTIKLRSLSSSREKKNPKVGDQSWATYSGGGLRVRIDYTITKLCAPNDEDCEVTYFRTIMTVTRGKQKLVMRTVGLCGC